MATNFAQWFFYQRKHNAAASGAEINNDRSEIENLKLIVQEWREAARDWKDMADEYRGKYISEHRLIEELRDEVASVNRKLLNANKRITQLEKEKANKTNKTPTDGNK